jgi:hypothetical protein
VPEREGLLQTVGGQFVLARGALRLGLGRQYGEAVGVDQAGVDLGAISRVDRA